MKTDDPVVVGFDHDAGRPAYVPVPGVGGAHALVGGSTGSGKSRAIYGLLAQLAERPNLALCINDPAYMDYAAWTPRASCMALGPEGGGKLMEWAEAEMVRRLKAGRRMGVTSLPVSEEWPRIVVVFDELAFVMSTVKGAEQRLTKLAQVSRKTAMGLVLATQHAKASIVSTLIRGQCPTRLCLRQKTPEGTDTILETQRHPAHLIPFDQVGVGFADLPDGRTVKVRCPFVSDDEARQIAARTAALTPDLGDGWQRVYDPDEEDVA